MAIRFPQPAQSSDDERGRRQRIRDRAVLVESLLGSRVWKEIVEPYMDEYRKVALDLVLKKQISGPAEAWLKGQVVAYEDLVTHLKVFLADEAQARRDEREDRVLEAESDNEPEAFRRF